MSGPTPLEKRNARKARNHSGLDMNLVALIDIFTILLFFLLSSATELETLAIPRAVSLPESAADTTPRPTVVVLVNAQEIVVDGKTVARTGDVMAAEADLIPTLQAELAAARNKVNGAEGKVTILGDKDIPYRLLRKVMSTCAQSQYTDVNFGVRTRLEAKT